MDTHIILVSFILVNGNKTEKNEETFSASGISHLLNVASFNYLQQ